MARRRRRKSNLEIIFRGLLSIFAIALVFISSVGLFLINGLGSLLKAKPSETSAETKGRIAETKVNSILMKYTKNNEALLFNDFIIGDDDKSSQIDQLLATVNAIYVIETKNYTGEIQGDTREAKWYRVTKNYDRGIKDNVIEFVNPFKQNDLHISRLQELVESASEFDIYNIVCFNDHDALDLSGILLNANDYVLTTTKSLLNTIEEIEFNYTTSSEDKTSTLDHVLESDKLRQFGDELESVIVTDPEEIKNHKRRLQLKQTKRINEENKNK
jgi:hypothetical protein